MRNDAVKKLYCRKEKKNIFKSYAYIKKAF